MESLPAGIYLLKVNNRNTRTKCEICSKLTINTPCSSVSIANFEQVNAGWVITAHFFDFVVLLPNLYLLKGEWTLG